MLYFELAVAVQAKKLDVNEDMRPLLEFLLNNGFTKDEIPKVNDANYSQEQSWQVSTIMKSCL